MGIDRPVVVFAAHAYERIAYERDWLTWWLERGKTLAEAYRKRVMA